MVVMSNNPEEKAVMSNSPEEKVVMSNSPEEKVVMSNSLEEKVVMWIESELDHIKKDIQLLSDTWIYLVT